MGNTPETAVPFHGCRNWFLQYLRPPVTACGEDGLCCEAVVLRALFRSTCGEEGLVRTTSPALSEVRSCGVLSPDGGQGTGPCNHLCGWLAGARSDKTKRAPGLSKWPETKCGFRTVVIMRTACANDCRREPLFYFPNFDCSQPFCYGKMLPC